MKRFKFVTCQISKFDLRSSSIPNCFIFLSHTSTILVLLSTSCLPPRPEPHFPTLQPKLAILRNKARPIYDVDPVSPSVQAQKTHFYPSSNYTFSSSSFFPLKKQKKKKKKPIYIQLDWSLK